MWKLPFGLSRPNNLGPKGENSRRRPRSCPRLERLEERIALSAFQVNTTLDTVAVNLSTGRDAAGHISLRSAIMATNAQGGNNTIVLPNGNYKLTLAGANEDAGSPATWTSPAISPSAARAPGTVIDGNNLDRVIHVLRGATNISGVSIRNGLASAGGGLLNSGGQVTLSSVVVTGNRAVGSSGTNGANGDDVHGALDGVTAFGLSGTNGNDGTAGLGGGIFNGAGSLTISDSTIARNQAIGGNGGKGGNGGLGQGFDVAIGNGQNGDGGRGGLGGAGAAGRGGGIYNAAGANLTLSGTLIASNVAQGGQGGDGGLGGLGNGGHGGAEPNGHQVKDGGIGTGGDGGSGGPGAPGEGGGLFNQCVQGLLDASPFSR